MGAMKRSGKQKQALMDLIQLLYNLRVRHRTTDMAAIDAFIYHRLYGQTYLRGYIL